MAPSPKSRRIVGTYLVIASCLLIAFAPWRQQSAAATAGRAINAWSERLLGLAPLWSNRFSSIPGSHVDVNLLLLEFLLMLAAAVALLVLRDRDMDRHSQ